MASKFTYNVKLPITDKTKEFMQALEMEDQKTPENDTFQFDPSTGTVTVYTDVDKKFSLAFISAYANLWISNKYQNSDGSFVYGTKNPNGTITLNEEAALSALRSTDNLDGLADAFESAKKFIQNPEAEPKAKKNKNSEQPSSKEGNLPRLLITSGFNTTFYGSHLIIPQDGPNDFLNGANYQTPGGFFKIKYDLITSTWYLAPNLEIAQNRWLEGNNGTVPGNQNFTHPNLGAGIEIGSTVRSWLTIYASTSMHGLLNVKSFSETESNPMAPSNQGYDGGFQGATSVDQIHLSDFGVGAYFFANSKIPLGLNIQVLGKKAELVDHETEYKSIKNGIGLELGLIVSPRIPGQISNKKSESEIQLPLIDNSQPTQSPSTTSPLSDWDEIQNELNTQIANNLANLPEPQNEQTDEITKEELETLKKEDAEATAEALPRLLEGLKSRDSQIRLYIIFLLYNIQPLTEEVKQALITALDDPDQHVRTHAALILGNSQEKAAVPALIDTLKDPDTNVRLYASYSLGCIGPDAKEAITALTHVSKSDPDESVRSTAKDALKKINQAQ